MPTTPQQAVVDASATAATVALGVVTAPLAANKGTTMSRLLAARECRWATPVPEPTQFVYVFELGGTEAAGALASTLPVQAVVAAAAAMCSRARRFPHVAVLHLALLSYYGPNVAALATSALTGGDEGVLAVAGLVVNAGLFGVAAASTWALALHHRVLWKDARDLRSGLVRVYGAVDLMCAFLIGALSGARGLVCATRGWLMCAACFVNLAHAGLVRPVAGRLDNALAATTALLVFGLSLLSVATPREPKYDEAVLALSIAVTVWMYLLLALAVGGSVRHLLHRRATKR